MNTSVPAYPHASDGTTGARRRGTVLIIVSGIAGLLSALTVVFLITVRSDLDDVTILVQEGQARLMLSSACSYIQEASRIGWDFPSAAVSPDGGTQSEYCEAFGWIDVRDGELGPRVNTAPNAAIGYSDNTSPPAKTFTSPSKVSLGTHVSPPDYLQAGAGNFPIGVARRFPMYVMTQPPYAIQLTVDYNPVLQAPNSDNGVSYLRYPDPQPVTVNGYPGTVSDANFASWCTGNRTPRENSYGMSWFRLVREPSGSVFTVTCGAGATMGYRTWPEVQADGPAAMQLFNNDQTLFNSLSDDEYRSWYRVEWSPATATTEMNYLLEGQEYMFILDTHTMVSGGAINGYSGGEMAPNMGGTIQWIQRLAMEPPYW
jgi:hypothetical protein